MKPFTHKTTNPMIVLNSCSRYPFLQHSTCHSQTHHESRNDTSLCLIRRFFVRLRISKYFMNSSKRFRSEVIFENEHMFCSEYMFVSARLFRNWREQRPSNMGDLCSSFIEEGESLLHGVDLLLALFCTALRVYFWVKWYILYKPTKQSSPSARSRARAHTHAHTQTNTHIFISQDFCYRDLTSVTKVMKLEVE
jgi:hypothetical protein